MDRINFQSRSPTRAKIQATAMHAGLPALEEAQAEQCSAQSQAPGCQWMSPHAFKAASVVDHQDQAVSGARESVGAKVASRQRTAPTTPASNAGSGPNKRRILLSITNANGHVKAESTVSAAQQAVLASRAIMSSFMDRNQHNYSKNIKINISRRKKSTVTNARGAEPQVLARTSARSTQYQSGTVTRQHRKYIELDEVYAYNTINHQSIFENYGRSSLNAGPGSRSGRDTNLQQRSVNTNDFALKQQLLLSHCRPTTTTTDQRPVGGQIQIKLLEFHKLRQRHNISAQQDYRHAAVPLDRGIKAPSMGFEGQHDLQRSPWSLYGQRSAVGNEQPTMSQQNEAAEAGKQDAEQVEVQDGQPQRQPAARSTGRMEDPLEAARDSSPLGAYGARSNGRATTMAQGGTRLRRLPGPAAQATKRRPDQGQRPAPVQLKEQQTPRSLPDGGGFNKNMHINLMDEYKRHLKCMNNLEQFKSMKFGWDHCFYKSLVHQFFDQETLERERKYLQEEIGKKFETTNLREAVLELVEEDHHSIAGQQNNTSALSVGQESLIPREPIVLSQNKKLIALLHESRGTMDEDWQNQDRMSTAELDEQSERSQLESFFKKQKEIFDRWLKVECEEQQNFASVLIMDTVIKAIIVRLDRFFIVKERQARELEDRMGKKLADTIKKCNEALELQKAQAKIEKAFTKKSVDEAQALTTSQRRQIGQLQQIVNERATEIHEMTRRDNRVEYLESLDDNLYRVNKLIREHETFRTRQYTLIGEYTKMVDIGITPIPKLETASQTDLSLTGQALADLKMAAGDVMLDSEIISKLYPPIVAACSGQTDEDKRSREPKRHPPQKFGEFYQFCEQVINRERLKAQHGEHEADLEAKQDQARPGEVIISPQYYQEKILDYYVKEKNHCQTIRTQCRDFVRTLSRLDSNGILYAQTVAKVFGFKAVSNYRGLVQAFLRERSKFLVFYGQEPEDNKTPGVQEQRMTDSLRRATKKNKKKQSRTKALKTEELNQQADPDEAGRMLEAPSPELKVDQEESSDSEPEDASGEQFQVLSILRVFEFIKQQYPVTKQLGPRIWDHVLQTLASKHTAKLIKMPSIGIEQLYTAQDSPVLHKRGAGDKSKDIRATNIAAKAGVIEAGIKLEVEKIDEEPAAAEEDGLLKKIEMALEPAVLREFSRIMVSLYLQSNSQPSEIVRVIKSHEQLRALPPNSITQQAFLEAVTKNDKFWLSAAQVRIIYRFMDPLADNDVLQVLDLKAFMNLFGNANLQSFTYKACINTTSILHGIFNGLEAHLLEFKASLASRIAVPTALNPIQTTLENADQLGVVPVPVAVNTPHRHNTFLISNPSLFTFLSEFTNFNDCVLASVPKSTPTERLGAFRAWMLSANALGSEQLRNNDILCQNLVAEKVIEAADNAMKYI